MRTRTTNEDGGAVPEILIAGGGIAGLATALALARQTPQPVTVLERRTEFSEAGAGIQLSPNAVHVLRRLGIADRLAPHVGVPSSIIVRDGASGRVLQRLPLGDWIAQRHGAPYWVAHRRDLQAALLDACREQSSIDLRVGVEATERHVAEIGARGGILVGADGVFSSVRARLHSRRPTFSGRTAARTIIQANAVHGDIDIAATGVWLSPGSHVVHYPVRQGREIAVVVIASEDWQEAGWSAPVTSAWLDAALSPFANAVRDLLGAGRDWRRWSLFEQPPLDQLAQGHVALAGDAAHPTLPFMAQGGCLALEDAVTLAHAVQSKPDRAEALAAYSQARSTRTRRVVAAASRNGRIFHLTGLAARARNAAMRAIPPKRVMAGYDWVYGWKPPT